MSEPQAPDLNGRPRLTWEQAVEAMRAGKYVRRASEMYLRCIEPTREADPDEDSHPWTEAGVYESGQEGCYLAHAWTDDNKPVRIFMGAGSRCLFVPDGEHMEATDWVVVERNEA
jgi:hypothetical protein